MRRGPFWAVTLLVLGTMVVTGCRTAEEPAPADDAADEAPQAERPTAGGLLAAVETEIPPGGEAAKESASGQSDPLCVGPIDLGVPETVELEGWTAEVNGYRVNLSRKGEAAGALTFGVIADIKEDTAENLFNLGRFVTWFQSQNVDAIVVTGDSGETDAGIVRALSRLAEPGWPVFVIIGNREARTVYADAMSKLQDRYDNVFDMNQRRLVQLPGAALVSLPGYHDPRFLHAESGCQYFREDVEALVPVAKAAEGPVFLVAHSGPRGATAQAVDYATEAGNVGDANINRLIAAAEIPFGLFAHIHEAGGKATDVLGRDLVEQGKAVSSFFLNVGPADSIRWLMNDGTESRGMAGMVRVEGEKAAYTIHRTEALTDAELAQARALDDAPRAEAETEDAE
jgi:Icc-related predicted phosphoesterase